MKFECDGEIIEAKTIEGGLVNSKDKIGEEIEIEYNKGKSRSLFYKKEQIEIYSYHCRNYFYSF